MADVMNTGYVRGNAAPTFAEGAGGYFHMTMRGEQIAANGAPNLLETVRLGNSWQVATATPLAALTTEPTTTTGLGIWNGNTGQPGVCLAIDSVAVWERVVDATQQNQLALFVMNNVAPVTAITDAGLTIRSLAGRKYSGAVRTLTNGAVTNDGWFACGNSTPNAAAVAGGAWRVTDVRLDGLYLVPPGGMFNVHAVKVSATASQCNFVIRWHEVVVNYVR